VLEARDDHRPDDAVDGLLIERTERVRRSSRAGDVLVEPLAVGVGEGREAIGGGGHWGAFVVSGWSSRC
jgi:hypothetical protein